MFTKRMNAFRDKLLNAEIDLGIICGDSNIYFFTGYCDFLHMEFGRPTILVVPRDEDSVLITPSMEFEMAKANAFVDRVELWNDGMGEEWRGTLLGLIKSNSRIGIEENLIPQIVRGVIEESSITVNLIDLTDLIADMRMIKSNDELKLARHAGQVAEAMMEAGRDAIIPGIREYEIALATAEAGTKKAAELLDAHYENSRMSPNIHFLQIMASGRETIMPHHRASTRKIEIGDPVFLCFCGMTNFHKFKLGFDRTFWVKEISDKFHKFIYQTALDSQTAALEILKPGVRAEEVHAAYAEVIQTAGFQYPFRCGRATGFSFLEKPQLVCGDKTILQSGMVFAVDGSVTTENFRAQVGDSIIVTDYGYEKITHHSNALEDMIIK